MLCPGAARGRGGRKVETLGRLASLVERLGARPKPLDARRHDQAMARLSHLPQLISVALVNAAAASPAGPLLEFSGPAFRQMSRLASSPPGLWDAILKSNRSAATEALDDFIRELRRLRRRIGRGVARDFQRAARFRARLERRERTMRPSARMHR